jgi:hypothetical protein
MAKTIVLIISILWTFEVYGQSSVKGYIFNAEGDALVSVSVKNEKTHKGCLTSGIGYFELKSVADNDTISIKYIGYETKYLVGKYIKSVDTIRLSSTVNQLKDVFISAENKYLFAYNIIVNTKKYFSEDEHFDVYFKEYVLSDKTIKYFSDASLQYDYNNGKLSAYLNASRSLKKIDSSDERILGKLNVKEDLKKEFDFFARLKSSVLSEDVKTLEKDYDLTIAHDSDQLKLTLTPNPSNTKSSNEIELYVNKEDSTIREIRYKLLPTAKGKLITSTPVSKQYLDNSEQVIRYSKDSGHLFLKSVFISQIQKISPAALASFKSITVQIDHLFVTTKSIIYAVTPLPVINKEYNSNKSLESLGKNYTGNFWEMVNDIQETDAERIFWDEDKN